MTNIDLPLVAHLMRRAGFGARQTELERLASKRYEDLVEDLLHPEKFKDADADVLYRWSSVNGRDRFPGDWLYRMINTGRPLTEKMALFWHHVFPTATSKSSKYVGDQIEMFRKVSMSDMRTILKELSSDPAMIMWLDNQENHRNEPNENYGRELLELFSMGVGNYTEEDVKSVARSFTGWSFLDPILGEDMREGGFPSQFVYHGGNHDETTKDFLGEAGRFNGEDILDIIVKQPACARFISRHLYTFFVSDEPQVASWGKIPPKDPDAIDDMVKAYFDSGGDIREILRVLFNSEFFKRSQYARIKSPAEHVAGVLKLVGTYTLPDLGENNLRSLGIGYGNKMDAMGQKLQDPLTVEGWHTGKDWIDGGTLNERVNFAVEQLSNVDTPGFKEIFEKLSLYSPLTPEAFVDRCLELVGYVVIDDETREGLMSYAELGGMLAFGNYTEREESKSRALRMLQLIVSTRQYQLN